jgi:hypothetical protein
VGERHKADSLSIATSNARVYVRRTAQSVVWASNSEVITPIAATIETYASSIGDLLKAAALRYRHLWWFLRRRSWDFNAGNPGVSRNQQYSQHECF